jgi:hypothetical protein
MTDHAVSPIELNENVKKSICKSEEGLLYFKANDNMNGRISVSKFIGIPTGDNNVTTR